MLPNAHIGAFLNARGEVSSILKGVKKIHNYKRANLVMNLSRMHYDI